MNKQELLAAAEVMRRAAGGEPVEVFELGKWISLDVSTLRWDWEMFNYRITPPKPREVWIHETQLNAGWERCPAIEGCKKYEAHSQATAITGKMIRFVEVLEEKS